LTIKKESMSLSERCYPPPSLKIALDVEKLFKEILGNEKPFFRCLQYFSLTLRKPESVFLTTETAD